MGLKLIYKNDKVCNLFNIEGSLYTRKSVYDCTSEEDCFNKIDELQLNYSGLSGGTINVLFSGGTRTIIEESE